MHTYSGKRRQNTKPSLNTRITFQNRALGRRGKATHIKKANSRAKQN